MATYELYLTNQKQTKLLQHEWRALKMASKKHAFSFDCDIRRFCYSSDTSSIQRGLR